jgi:two-component system response regulator HydG
MPPLRERGRDVLLLACYFLDKFSKKFGKQFTEISKDAEQMLVNYTWPGNVRELKNMLERAVLLEQGPVLSSEALPPELLRAHRRKKVDEFLYPATENGELPALADVERRYIKRVLEQVDGNKSKAARILQISRQSLIERLRRIKQEVVSEPLSK